MRTCISESDLAIVQEVANGKMTLSTDIGFQPSPAELEQRYQAISQDPRYGHYARIPARICRCLDYFNVVADRRAIHDRLSCYYLFIGVADEAIDSIGLEVGCEILERLAQPTPCCSEETLLYRARLVTAVLKHHLSAEIHPAALVRFDELYQAVVRERNSRIMSAYIEARKTIGRLTAHLSYLLITPLLNGEYPQLCRFIENVGEVGCLMDSVIDLRSDLRRGLLGFRPTAWAYLKLTGQMLHEGLKILLQHPRLLGLFLEAVRDTWLDQLRQRAAVRRVEWLALPRLDSFHSTE